MWIKPVRFVSQNGTMHLQFSYMWVLSEPQKVVAPFYYLLILLLRDDAHLLHQERRVHSLSKTRFQLVIEMKLIIFNVGFKTEIFDRIGMNLRQLTKCEIVCSDKCEARMRHELFHHRQRTRK